MGACRFCSSPLSRTFVDLGCSPLANSLRKPDQMNKMEPFYPLHAYVCENCFLVQLEEYESPEAIFDDYVYFASFSSSWLAHCKRYAERMIDLLRLDDQSRVIEIASNDGYLLQYFKEKNVPVVGIEPAKSVAATAMEKGIPTEIAFFNKKKALEMRAHGLLADLTVANNVLAHVPDINDFVEAFGLVLRPDGVATFEFPHLLRLIEGVQFDTIYHEHFSYLSLYSVKRIFEAGCLRIFDVEELKTHGGSLRVYAQPAGGSRPLETSVERVLEKEREAGLLEYQTYSDFSERVKRVKRDLMSLLIGLKENGETIVGYGAAAKGNTLLNYCGIGRDFLDYVVDKNPHKQDQFMPGSRIEIFPVEKIAETRPDYLLLLPWNLKDEISDQMSGIRTWGGRFIVPIPTPYIF